MNVEACACLLAAWTFFAAAAVFLERLCSCYFPWLLTARFYCRIKNPVLRGLLISPQRTRSPDSKTAPGDRDKLPLLGCVYCAVAVPWFLFGFILLLLLLVWGLTGSELACSPLAERMEQAACFLFTCPLLWIFMAGMPILSSLDYSIGLRCWRK